MIKKEKFPFLLIVLFYILFFITNQVDWLGGDALCAYLVVVLRDRLNQVLWRMMDEPRRFMRNENRSIHWGPLALCRYAVLMSVEVRKYTECWQNGQSCAERDMQRCTSASKDVK